MRVFVIILLDLLLSAGVFLIGSHAAYCDVINLPSPVINFDVAGVPIPTFTSQPATSVFTNTDATYTTQRGMSSYIWTIPGTLNTDYTIVSGGISSTTTLTRNGYPAYANPWTSSNTNILTINTLGEVTGIAAGTSEINDTYTSGCSKKVSLTVNTLPVCSFTGTDITCPNNTNTFYAPSGMANYSWGMTGNSSINGITIDSNINFTAGNINSSPYTLSVVLTIDFNSWSPTSISGTGQTSTYASDIQFPGNATVSADDDHTINYCVAGCNGNTSDNKTCNISVKQRPNFLKIN